MDSHIQRSDGVMQFGPAEECDVVAVLEFPEGSNEVIGKQFVVSRLCIDKCVW